MKKIPLLTISKFCRRVTFNPNDPMSYVRQATKVIVLNIKGCTQCRYAIHILSLYSFGDFFYEI